MGSCRGTSLDDAEEDCTIVLLTGRRGAPIGWASDRESVVPAPVITLVPGTDEEPERATLLF